MKNLTVATLVILLSAMPVAFANIAETNVIASWYGGGEPLNEYTASGDIFNAEDLTCASWYYAFGTLLKVTNLDNGKCVIVRVNDRGPNKRLGRAVDLTRYAFSQIADTRHGLIRVNIEQVRRT